MQDWRRSRWANPARWYTVAGLAALGLSLWLPWMTAARTARVEQRADRIAELLLRAARDRSEPAEEAGLQFVLARFHGLAAAEGVFVSDLERVEPAPPGTLLCLTNKHYAFQLAATPLPPNQVPGRDSVAAVEVIAWPLTATGPGHSAYFHPEDGPRAYSRNLYASYAGLGGRRPQPGSSHRPLRRQGDELPGWYRGADDERWIVF